MRKRKGCTGAMTTDDAEHVLQELALLEINLFNLFHTLIPNVCPENRDFFIPERPRYVLME